MIVWKIELSEEHGPQPISYHVPDNANSNTSASKFSSDLSYPIILKREDRTGTDISEPLHSHAFIEMEYIVGGTCVQTINGKEYIAKKGDAFFFDVGDKHSYRASSDIQLINCIFYSDIFNSMSENDKKHISIALLPNVIHLSGKFILEFENILFKMEEEFAKKAYGYSTILKNYVIILISLLLRFTRKTAQKVDKTTSEILEYLDDHYADSSLNSMAQQFNFSPSYFSRYFKKNVGVSFSQYIRTKRTKEAVRLLTTTDISIENICLQIGFSSKNQFYKLFHELLGTTPRNIRNAKTGFLNNPNSEDDNL